MVIIYDLIFVLKCKEILTYLMINIHVLTQSKINNSSYNMGVKNKMLYQNIHFDTTSL